MPPERNWLEIERFLAGLEGVRLHNGPRGRRWSVRSRLVARQVDESTLLIRTGFDLREELLEKYPGTFSLRPDLEAHMKVLADVRHGHIAAVCQAILAAWKMQRAGVA